jgi:hypothetical protein
MAQNALTVTPPNPTPPTNMSFVGATPPTDPAQAAADDGTAGTWSVFAAKTAAAGSGTSVDHEGKGTETVVTQSYNSAVYNPAGPLTTFSDLGNYTTTPNGQHASSLSPATNPALASISPTTAVSGAGTVVVTCTGTNFTKQSVICTNVTGNYAGLRTWPTTFVNSTTLTATITKPASAENWQFRVRTGGAVETPSQAFTFT